MEPSYQTRKIIGRVAALVALLLLAGGFWAHYSSGLVRRLAAREDTPVRIAVFTKPAMLFTYNPTSYKTRVLVAAPKCTFDKQENCFKEPYDAFFIPQETDQATYWAQFKNNLANWRFKPLAVWEFFRAYVNALVQKRTNLRPSVFLLLSKELIELTSTDFAIEYTSASAKKKKGTAKKAEAPATDTKPEIVLPAAAKAADRPLVVEILNASGKKGIALAATQYLREQNAKGLLRIDVIQYDNYPSQEEKSFIVDYSGKLVQVTQASHALGISGEIRSEKSATAICDTRIILGKDFQLPL